MRNRRNESQLTCIGIYQAGVAPAARVRGSCSWWCSLLVSFVEKKASGARWGAAARRRRSTRTQHVAIAPSTPSAPTMPSSTPQHTLIILDIDIGIKSLSNNRGATRFYYSCRLQYKNNKNETGNKMNIRKSWGWVIKIWMNSKYSPCFYTMEYKVS